MSSCENKVLGLDQFGTPISLNYRGSESYKTWLGALVTITTQVLVLITIVRVCGEFWTREGQTEVFRQEKIDINSKEQFQLGAMNSTIALFTHEYLDDQIHGEWQAYRVTKDKSAKEEKILEPISLHECEEPVRTELL